MYLCSRLLFSFCHKLRRRSLGRRLCSCTCMESSLYSRLKIYFVFLTFLSVQQTVEKSLFLNYFYKHCMHRVMAPLMAQTAGERVSNGKTLKQGYMIVT